MGEDAGNDIEGEKVCSTLRAHNFKSRDRRSWRILGFAHCRGHSFARLWHFLTEQGV